MSTQILVAALLTTLAAGFNLGLAVNYWLERRTLKARARNRELLRRLANYSLDAS